MKRKSIAVQRPFSETDSLPAQSDSAAPPARSDFATPYEERTGGARPSKGTSKQQVKVKKVSWACAAAIPIDTPFLDSEAAKLTPAAVVTVDAPYIKHKITAPASTQRFAKILHAVHKDRASSHYRVTHRAPTTAPPAMMSFVDKITSGKKGIVKAGYPIDDVFGDMVAGSIANFLVSEDQEMSRVSLHISDDGTLSPYIKFLQNTRAYKKEPGIFSAQAFALSFALGDHDGHIDNVLISTKEDGSKSLIRIDWGFSFKKELPAHYVLQRSFIQKLPIFEHAVTDPSFAEKMSRMADLIIDKKEELITLTTTAIRSFNRVFENYKEPSLTEFNIKYLSHQIMGKDSIDCIRDPKLFSTCLYHEQLFANAIEMKFMSFAIRIHSIIAKNSADMKVEVEGVFQEINEFEQVIDLPKPTIHYAKQISFALFGVMIRVNLDIFSTVPEERARKLRIYLDSIYVFSKEQIDILETGLIFAETLAHARNDFILSYSPFSKTERREGLFALLAPQISLKPLYMTYARNLVDLSTSLWKDSPGMNHLTLWKELLNRPGTWVEREAASSSAAKVESVDTVGR